jgi:hypothetical protein
MVHISNSELTLSAVRSRLFDLMHWLPVVASMWLARSSDHMYVVSMPFWIIAEEQQAKDLSNSNKAPPDHLVVDTAYEASPGIYDGLDRMPKYYLTEPFEKVRKPRVHFLKVSRRNDFGAIYSVFSVCIPASQQRRSFRRDCQSWRHKACPSTGVTFLPPRHRTGEPHTCCQISSSESPGRSPEGCP